MYVFTPKKVEKVRKLKKISVANRDGGLYFSLEKDNVTMSLMSFVIKDFTKREMLNYGQRNIEIYNYIFLYSFEVFSQSFLLNDK